MVSLRKHADACREDPDGARRIPTLSRVPAGARFAYQLRGPRQSGYGGASHQGRVGVGRSPVWLAGVGLLLDLCRVHGAGGLGHGTVRSAPGTRHRRFPVVGGDLAHWLCGQCHGLAAVAVVAGCRRKRRLSGQLQSYFHVCARTAAGHRQWRHQLRLPRGPRHRHGHRGLAHGAVGMATGLHPLRRAVAGVVVAMVPFLASIESRGGNQADQRRTGFP